MAGIDNNTLLYLRGDSFNDLSPNKIDVVNSGVAISNEGAFKKCFSFSNSSTFMYFTSNLFNFGTNDFTIEFFAYLNDTHSYHPLFMSGTSGTREELAKCSIYENRIDYAGTLGTSGTNPISGLSNYGSRWIHVAMVRNNDNLKIYLNGESTGDGKTQSYNLQNTRYSIGKDLWHPNNYFNGKMYNIRISNVARYTKDFTPPTQPFNSLNINVSNQTDTNIEFNIEKLGQETINKVEVLVNGTVSETYTNNYDNINYLIDKELCSIGDNNITIRVTFDDIYTEELSLTHKVIVDELPLETPLLDTVERVKLLTKSKQNEKTMLSNILTSKNVEVSEEDKMSDLIGKVDLLGDATPPQLYLYKEGDECVDITGGWQYYNASSTVTKNGSYMDVKILGSSTVDGCSRFSTVNAIDLTPYSNLYIEYNNVGTVPSSMRPMLLQIRNSKSNANTDIVAEVNGGDAGTTTSNKTIISLNISSINKSVYIVDTNGPNSGGQSRIDRIYKIWLEK